MDWLVEDFVDNDSTGFSSETFSLGNLTGFPGNWSFLNVTLGPDDYTDEEAVDPSVINTLIALCSVMIFIMMVILGYFLVREYKPWKRKLYKAVRVRYRPGSNNDLQGLVV